MRYAKIKGKRALLWETIGKSILVLIVMVMVLFILSKFFTESSSLVQKIKGFFGG